MSSRPATSTAHCSPASSCWSARHSPLTRAIERVAGLQTQYAPSAYIGLWSRLREFSRDSLTKALERRREGRIRLEQFGRLTPAVRTELEDEAKRLAAFHAD